MTWALQCSVCLNLFPLSKVYRESMDFDGHCCSKICWDKVCWEDDVEVEA